MPIIKVPNKNVDSISLLCKYHQAANKLFETTPYLQIANSQLLRIITVLTFGEIEQRFTGKDYHCLLIKYYKLKF